MQSKIGLRVGWVLLLCSLQFFKWTANAQDTGKVSLKSSATKRANGLKGSNRRPA